MVAIVHYFSQPNIVCTSFLGILGFCPYFVKNLAQYSYFETIYVCVPVLVLDFKKIELQVELDISNVEFYAYFAT